MFTEDEALKAWKAAHRDYGLAYLEKATARRSHEINPADKEHLERLRANSYRCAAAVIRVVVDLAQLIEVVSQILAYHDARTISLEVRSIVIGALYENPALPIFLLERPDKMRALLYRVLAVYPGALFSADTVRVAYEGAPECMCLFLDDMGRMP